jgi:hypothetical protein
MPTPFNEDFFERVVNVKWEAEPDVYWMAATGYCKIVNGFAAQSSMLFTSDDGLHWTGPTELRKDWPAQGMGAVFTGCWMRQELKQGNTPVWVLAGANSTTGSIGAVVSSLDGKTVGEPVLLDLRHAAEKVGKTTKMIESVEVINGVPQKVTVEVPCIRIRSRFTIPGYYDHSDAFTSTDGVQWEPDHYHFFDDSGNLPGIGVGPALANAGAGAVPMQSPSGTIIKYISIFLVQIAPSPHLVSPAAGLPALMMSELAKQKADKKTFKSSGISAVGKLRKGQFADKVVKMTLDPWHTLPGGGDHGDSTIAMIDNKTQKSLGTTDCGVTRTITIGYGHYVFVVGGSSDPELDGPEGRAQRSTLAYTEDGENWNVIEFGDHFQITTIVVGPRPDNISQAPQPFKPDADTPSPDPPAPDPPPPPEPSDPVVA